jgi:hypothetical protein
MDIAAHLFKRGLAAYAAGSGDDNTPPPKVNVPTWVVVMLATTAIGFFFIMVMVCPSSPLPLSFARCPSPAFLTPSPPSQAS